MTIYFDLPENHPNTRSSIEFDTLVAGPIHMDADPQFIVDLGGVTQTITLTPLGGSWWRGYAEASPDWPELSLRFISQAPPFEETPFAYIYTATYTYYPPFPEGTTGVWPLRQRQSLIGPGSWPLRQRQTGGHSGSWALRQRQTGT